MNSPKSPYTTNTPRSRDLYNRASRVMPGGVSHNLRFNPPYPPYYKSGRGAYFEDADNNRYLDFWMGHYANILGHSPPVVRDLLRELVEQGTGHCGLENEYTVKLAELVCDTVPAAERIRFCTTGTEASMYAVRLARAVTGRRLIVKIEGGWHGANSDLMYTVNAPYDKPDSLGLSPGLQDTVIPLRFNDLAAAERVLEKYGAKAAAIIMEPVVGVGGFIPASPEFLALLREGTKECGALLIFDEIISGFRVAPGGAQELLGTVPDLVLLGKILGGGLPAAAIAGKEAIMERTDFKLHPHKWERTAAGGGTFSCSPLAMAAGYAVIDHLRRNRREIYPRLAAAGARVREGMVKAFAAAGIEAVCSGVGSLFMPHFPLNPGLSVKSPYDGNCRTDVHKREVVLKTLLLDRGVYVMHGGGAVSTAHSQSDLEIFIAAVGEAAREMTKKKK